MASKDIKRRAKTGPSKLVTELRLYKSLYADWQMRQDPALSDEDKKGVPMHEIESYTSAKPRTLSRYLQELVLCGAVESVRKSGAYYSAKFAAMQKTTAEDDIGAKPHLLRLSRTTLLMRERLNWHSLPYRADYPNTYIRAFFDSLNDAKDWYECVCYGEVKLRTIQRDLQAVWEALGNDT